MINSVGLQNIGARAFTAKNCRCFENSRPVIANVFGYAAEDYLEVIRILNDAEGLAAYELNVSCPNTKHGGLAFGVDEAAFPIWSRRSKLWPPGLSSSSSPPNVAAIEPFALASEQNGADAISLVNTFISLAIDARTRKPRIGAGYGGLSGPAIKPIALRMVHQAARAVRIPVIGIGGIACGRRCRRIPAGRGQPGGSGNGDFLGSRVRPCASPRTGWRMLPNWERNSPRT